MSFQWPQSGNTYPTWIGQLAAGPPSMFRFLRFSFRQERWIEVHVPCWMIAKDFHCRVGSSRGLEPCDKKTNYELLPIMFQSFPSGEGQATAAPSGRKCFLLLIWLGNLGSLLPHETREIISFRWFSLVFSLVPPDTEIWSRALAKNARLRTLSTDGRVGISKKLLAAYSIEILQAGSLFIFVFSWYSCAQSCCSAPDPF